MSRIRVGVKFCGHCNPLFEGMSIIETAAAIDAHIDFVPWNDPEKSVLLIISCCLVDCIDRPAFSGQVVNVAGSCMNGKVLPVEGMAAALVTSIRKSCELSEPEVKGGSCESGLSSGSGDGARNNRNA